MLWLYILKCFDNFYMTKIHLTTFIAAPIDRVFNLSCSIDLHKISTAHTKEEAISGTTTGLIKLNETVTWQAKHLFKKRKFTSKIVSMETPFYFIDEMIQGDFKYFKHTHHFKVIDNGTIMIDIILFESPFGFIGRLFNVMYLKHYLSILLTKRNDTIKDFAESEKWRTIL
jgi:ligand-binding SRPBCC domain-containing protein